MAENASCDCVVVHGDDGSSAVFQETREEECPLWYFPEGTRLRIRELRGCGRVTSRLYSLGFTPGTIITVCGSGGIGGCRVQVRDTCVALDSRAAKSIVCAPVSRGG